MAKSKKEVVRAGVAIEVERHADGWHAWIYRKVGRRWVTAGSVEPRPTMQAARAAALAATVRL